MSLHRPQHSNSKRFSREGFKPIPADNMASGDATIDIPLETVQSNGGGLRNQSSTTALRPDQSKMSSEKRRLFRGRRARPEDRPVRVTGKVGYDGEEDTVNTMGVIYKKILNFSVLVGLDYTPLQGQC